MTTKPNDFDDYDRELEAAANTPERIREDAETVRRGIERHERELASLRAQGMVEESSDEDE